jgi:CcmD family protein
MTDVEYVVAAYVVIMGGLGAYTVFLWRRRRALRDRDDEAR